MDSPTSAGSGALTAPPYTPQQALKIDGATHLRNNLITNAAGLTLLAIPFFEWDQVPFREGDKQVDYLRQRVAAALSASGISRQSRGSDAASVSTMALDSPQPAALTRQVDDAIVSPAN